MNTTIYLSLTIKYYNFLYSQLENLIHLNRL